MQKEDKRHLQAHAAGKVTREQGKAGNSCHQQRRHDADSKARGTEMLQEELQKRGLQHNRKAETPEKLNQRHTEDIAFEVVVFLLIHPGYPRANKKRAVNGASGHAQ